MKPLAEQESSADQIRHYLKIHALSKGVIRPNFIVIGDTGSGKTSIIRHVAKEIGTPLVEINMAAITREGHSGNSLSKALGPLKFTGGAPSIVYMDEWDKTLIGSSGQAHDFTMDLQYELLKLLEEGETQVFADYGKYTSVSVSKCLFVFSGSFYGAEIECLEDLHKYGVRNEFFGRVGQLVLTSNPSLDSLFDLVPESELLNEYLRLFPIEKEKAVMGVQEIIMNTFENDNTGVRMVNSAIHNFFLDLNQEPKAPEEKPKRKVTRTRSN